MASATKIAVSMVWKAQKWCAGCMVSVSPQSAAPAGHPVRDSRGRLRIQSPCSRFHCWVLSPKFRPATLMRRVSVGR